MVAVWTLFAMLYIFPIVIPWWIWLIAFIVMLSIGIQAGWQGQVWKDWGKPIAIAMGILLLMSILVSIIESWTAY